MNIRIVVECQTEEELKLAKRIFRVEDNRLRIESTFLKLGRNLRDGQSRALPPVAEQIHPDGTTHLAFFGTI